MVFPPGASFPVGRGSVRCGSANPRCVRRLKAGAEVGEIQGKAWDTAPARRRGGTEQYR